MSSVFFFAYIGLMKHFVADVGHIKPLLRETSGFEQTRKKYCIVNTEILRVQIWREKN